MRSTLACLLFVGCVALSACANTDFKVGAAPDASVDTALGNDLFGGYPDLGDSGPGSDAKPAGCEEAIDVVFVIDLSSSMKFFLESLRTGIDSVVTAANKLKAGAHFGLVPFIDNHVIDTSGPEEGGKVHTSAPTLQQAFDHYTKVYTDHDRNPGDGPSGPTTQNPICEENSLDAIGAAATEFPWRKTATRIVIVATDDTFLEAPDNYGDRDGDGKWDKQDFPREGNYPAKRTLDQVVGALKSTKIRVFSFARIAPPGLFDPGGCGTGRRLPPEQIPAGWSKPYKGKQPIPEASQGKNFDLLKIRDGQISLADTINDVVLESHCKPIL